MAENTYNISDFEGLIFNVYRIEKNTNVFELFPKLSKYTEFVSYSGGEFNKVIKYIGLLYDFNSPLNKITDVTRRKIESAKLAGFEVDKSGKFSDEVEDMMRCKNKVVNSMIIRYCHLSKSDLFPFYVAQTEWLDKTYLQMLKGDLKVVDSTKILDIVNSIQSIRSQILGGDNNKALNDDLIDFIDSSTFELRPEDIAIKIAEGKNPLGNYNPYEDVEFD